MTHLKVFFQKSL